MDFGFSGEMIFVALLGLILFGPRKLPEIARKVGGFVDDLKRAGAEFKGQLNREVESLDPAAPKDSDSTKNLLTSLFDDFRTLNHASERVQAAVSFVEPAQTQQQRNGVPLIDSVSRIRDILDAKDVTAETPAVDPSPVPAEVVSANASNSAAADQN
jgi:Sec-independent protein translocase protein TatA